MPRTPYFGVYDRLVRTTYDPENEQACWLDKMMRRRSRGGYARFNLYVPGLRKKIALSSHVALWVILQAEVGSADDAFLAYLEFRCSKLTLDHLCYVPSCRNPDHLLPVTQAANNQLRSNRKRTGSWLI